MGKPERDKVYLLREDNLSWKDLKPLMTFSFSESVRAWVVMRAKASKKLSKMNRLGRDMVIYSDGACLYLLIYFSTEESFRLSLGF
ncbi:hypothetical protein AYI69_g3367 [Smittium culicis]|uniref:Uncharacterized protein n=1 Tax=Smittium culicis TaxID=133412 RepID=A0A1R1YJZ5_9FUNG|nr:hypothetical protein AYI69_g3367 [Smittium culicis]